MKVLKFIFTYLVFFAARNSFALEPNELLVITNSDITASVRIGRYYCEKRAVPAGNILSLPLGTTLGDTISRSDYEARLAGPIRNKLRSAGFAGKIRCLVTTYGVPIKVGNRGQLEGQEDKLKQLRKQLEQIQNIVKQIEQSGSVYMAGQKEQLERRMAYLRSAIDKIIGKETDASVDSELSMVLFDDYELYRWRPNKLKYKLPYWDFKSLMVSRLDGPGEDIAVGLVDKAILAEQIGLKGIAYIDSGYGQDKAKDSLYAKYDELLSKTALILRQRTTMKVVEEQTQKVFEAGRCPMTALYCGWYSLKQYVDAFDFVEGAVGYHIASWEAIDLRDPNSSQWCPAMLKDGITATLGPVAEPYLRSFPEPDAFFSELLDGRCLVEAYYRTKPFNSWRFVLIGDPLYRPFGKKMLPAGIARQ